MTERNKARDRIAGSVSPERLMADTEEIARWVRLSGSEEERAAFDYVEQTLGDLGLRTTRRLARAYVSLPESAELTVEGEDVPAITHSMAPSTSDGGLDLPLIYVGAGAPEDYEGREVMGRAVLVDGIAIPGKATAAEEAAAAACIFANADEHVHEMIVSTLWGSPTPEDRERLPKIPMASVGAAGAEKLRAACEAENVPTVHLSTRVSASWREIPTLVSQMDGAEEPEKFVLLSGHIDSWHRGAMDNGSANALMLEVVRVLLSERESLRRSLRIAFWSGHSHGRYAGSTWYADNFWEDLNDNCVLHLNADSTGGRGATVVTEGQTMAETKAVAADAVREITGEDFGGSRFGRSGDQSFMALGVPSLFMFVSEQPPGQDASAGDVVALLSGPGARGGGVGWWWHTTEDTPDKVDPALLARDTKIVAASAHRFLSEAVLPIDIGASADELLAHLRDWQEKARGRFDLSGALSRAEEVADLAAKFGTRASAPQDESVTRVNDLLMRVDKNLVRLNYAVADPYGHDPAVGQPPLPLLSPVDRLLQTDPDSAEEAELLVLLVRRRNRIMHELAEAIEKLRRGLGQ